MLPKVETRLLGPPGRKNIQEGGRSGTCAVRGPDTEPGTAQPGGPHRHECCAGVWVSGPLYTEHFSRTPKSSHSCGPEPSIFTTLEMKVVLNPRVPKAPVNARAREKQETEKGRACPPVTLNAPVTLWTS